MDTDYHVVYIHQDVREDRLIRAPKNLSAVVNGDAAVMDSEPLAHVLEPLLGRFNHIHAVSTSTACIAKVFQLQDASIGELRPIVVLIDTPVDEQTLKPPRSHSRSSSSSLSRATDEIHTPDENVYGLQLLRTIVSEARMRNATKLVVPIPILSDRSSSSSSSSSPAGNVSPNHLSNSANHLSNSANHLDLLSNRHLVRRCLDLGAADVVSSPLSEACLPTVEACAYRACREAAREQKALLELRRGRQRSWVGVTESKPYAYLREAMVSGLMKHICRSGDSEERIGNVRINVSSDRRDAIAIAVGRWDFCAHQLSDDELIIAAMIIFKHALAFPELKKWALPTDHLINFLAACRTAYNSFVPFHNFCHVVDVLQATFHFLVRIGTLPPLANASQAETEPVRKSPLALLLHPFDALTLLITAIGHDVGHPGVNNGFLITLDAPLAQLYNDRSVLESFHCAAYSQILRRYWPAAFEDAKMRSLMISSILATDMGLHFDYMKKLDVVHEKLREAEKSADGGEVRMPDEHKPLVCALLIKCADISNVARKHDTALRWMQVLADEFARQSTMEKDLDIPTSLMAEPKKDTASMSRNQLGFMNLFAIPLFQGVARIMPAMRYTVRELELNKSLFEKNALDGHLRVEKLDKADRAGKAGKAEKPERLETAPPSTTGSRSVSVDESNGSPCGSVSKMDGRRLLKKKSSRFRINALPFFKRNKGSSPPLSTADTTG